MCRILRWTGYASTLIGAILIIMAIIGGFRCHHHYVHVHACCNMQQSGGNMAVVKSDSAICKQHSMSINTPMGKQDSAKCFKKQVMCANAAPMSCNGCQMYNHRIGFHMGLAICFLLLAIALFMISNSCRCKKCCECKDGKCECKEEKKE
jgi:hypothetical protein